MVEQSSAPPAPPANKVRLFGLDVNGLTRPHIRDDSGNIVQLEAASGAGGSASNVLTGQTLWVDPVNGNNSTAVRGNQSLQYRTLAAAAAAQNGDTIMIRPGTNMVAPGSVVFDAKTNISVIGFGPGSILQASAQGQIIVVSNCTAVHIEGVTLKGTVTTKSGGTGYYALLELGGTNNHVTVVKNRFLNSGDHGIAHLYGPRSSYNLRVIDNYFEQIGGTNNSTFGGGVDGTAVAVAGGDSIIAFNRMHNVLRGVEIEGAPSGDYKHRIRVVGNTLNGIWEGNRDFGYGIAITANSADGQSNILAIEISGNLIDAYPEATGRFSVGIYVSGGNGVTIRDNKVQRTANGIMVSANMPMNGCQIIGNEVGQLGEGGAYSILVTGSGTLVDSAMACASPAWTILSLEIIR